jgi:hypothetical protein
MGRDLSDIAMFAGVAHFADIKPVIQISEVKI